MNGKKMLQVMGLKSWLELFCVAAIATVVAALIVWELSK